MTTEDARIMVKAFFTKPRQASFTASKTILGEGFFGANVRSDIGPGLGTKGCVLSEKVPFGKSFVPFAVRIVRTAVRTPIKYMLPIAAMGKAGKKTDASITYTGSLALHDIYGMVSMVR